MQWQESFDPTRHSPGCVDWMLARPGRNDCICQSASASSSSAAPASALPTPGRAAPAAASSADLVEGSSSDHKTKRSKHGSISDSRGKNTGKTDADAVRDYDGEMRATIHWAVTLASGLHIQGLIDVIVDCLFVKGTGNPAPREFILNVFVGRDTDLLNFCHKPRQSLSAGDALGGLLPILRWRRVLLSPEMAGVPPTLATCSAHYEVFKRSIFTWCANCGQADADCLPCTGGCPRANAPFDPYLVGYDGWGSETLVNWRHSSAIDLMLLSGRIRLLPNCDQSGCLCDYKGRGRDRATWRIARHTKMSNIIESLKRGGYADVGFTEIQLRSECKLAEAFATRFTENASRRPATRRGAVIVGRRYGPSSDTDSEEETERTPLRQDPPLLDDEADSIEVEPLVRSAPNAFDPELGGDASGEDE